MVHNNYQSYNLIGLYHFWGISPRNLTSFTRLFLTGRRTQAEHKTTQNYRAGFSSAYVTHIACMIIYSMHFYMHGTKVESRFSTAKTLHDFVHLLGWGTVNVTAMAFFLCAGP